MKPIILCILDGWGIASPAKDNAIYQANPKNYNRFCATYPHSKIDASGISVGLPDNQMGNSEVGHMSIGAGRVMMQELPRISHAVLQNNHLNNAAVQNFLQKINKKNKIHLIGLISDGGVHAHIDHIIGYAKSLMAMGYEVILHAITDGRDTPPQSALTYLHHLETKIPNLKIATISGRYFAMDRDNNWQRTQGAFDAIIYGKGQIATDCQSAIKHAYDNQISDEFIKPVAIDGYKGLDSGDGIIFCNFRADRARQLSQALGAKDFDKFPRDNFIANHPKLAMVAYSDAISQYFMPIFTKESVANGLGELLAKHNLTQLRLAETEKYAHVTFFMNGGQEEIFQGEERILIASPKVKTYDLQPQMSAFEITDILCAKIKEQKTNVIIVNFANADMVGHTGNFAAAIKAVQVIDECLGRIESAVLAHQGIMFITADHGNIESMHDADHNQPNTAHSTNLVPFIMVHQEKNRQFKLKDGILADIAPTILTLLNIAKPKEMTGNSLIL